VHVIQLLYELRCMEGVFSITSALQTQLMSRIFSEDLQAQLNTALRGDGPWLIEAGKDNLEKGYKIGSYIAQTFFHNGKLIYNESYVPFFKKSNQLFRPVRLVEENKFYTIADLQDIAQQQLDLRLTEFTKLKYFALKLGKPADALALIDSKGNYSNYRNLLKLSIRDKQVFVPYMGVLRRDLIFTMEGGDNYVDEKKRFMNFRKASVLYEYVLTYLSPQMNFLGY